MNLFQRSTIPVAELVAEIDSATAAVKEARKAWGDALGIVARISGALAVQVRLAPPGTEETTAPLADALREAERLRCRVVDAEEDLRVLDEEKVRRDRNAALAAEMAATAKETG